MNFFIINKFHHNKKFCGRQAQEEQTKDIFVEVLMFLCHGRNTKPMFVLFELALSPAFIHSTTHYLPEVAGASSLR
jgi:hypothetical protein